MTKILFPIFTNGTYMDEQYFDLLEDHPGGCTLYERRTDVERILNEFM